MWQPIETAPEAKEVLCAWLVLGKWCIEPCIFIFGRWAVTWDLSDVSPTHWMPLPEPPK